MTLIQFLGLSHRQEDLTSVLTCRGVGLAAGCSSVSVTDLVLVPPHLHPQTIKLPGTDSLTKIFLILSFLIVSMQLMELYLQRFFFLEFTTAKNLIISPLSTEKKHLQKRRTLKTPVVLTLLPKIDILRLTKRQHKKEPLQSVNQPTTSHFLYNAKQKVDAHLPLHISQPRFCVCSNST